MVAPIHAVIENSEQPVIYDLASESGVFVNGRKAVTLNLHAGDSIQIGLHTLVFGIEELSLEIPRELTREVQGRRLFLDEKEDFSSLLLEDEREVREIFDMRPTRKSALEVVMSWNEVILNVEHFTNEKAVVLGESRRSHFGIPPLLSAKRHLLAEREGTVFVLNVDPKMTGVILRKGQLSTIEAVRNEGRTSIPLEAEDFVKLTLGSVSFYLSYTAAPPRLKLSRMWERDPFFTKIFVSSMLLTAVTVMALLNAHVPATLEAEQLPDRIATILYQPEKYIRRTKVEPAPKEKPVEQPKPVAVAKIEIKPSVQNPTKPVPKEMTVGRTDKPKLAQGPKSPGAQKQAKEGEGARAKGKEGTRGSKKAAVVVKQQPQTAAARPAPQGGPGKGSGSSEVPDIGNVDFLKGAGNKIQNILGNSAAKLGKGGEKLKGFGGFDTFGNEGLALSGTGKGGGGTAETLGGLGNKGIGGGRVGTGLGAAGSGSGIIGGHSRVAIRTGGPEEAVVMGAIDASAVEAALLAHRDEFRLCYERELNAENQKLAGRVGTTFVIGSSGKVAQAGVESTSLKNANTESCILQVIRRIQFPIPRGAGLVQVSYPFKFVQR